MQIHELQVQAAGPDEQVLPMKGEPEGWAALDLDPVASGPSCTRFVIVRVTGRQE